MDDSEAREQSSPELPPVRLTDAAVEFVKRRREKMGQPNAALRVGVRGGGCNGLTYVTDLTEDRPTERELVYEFSGLTVLVDKRSLKSLAGSVVDAQITLMHQGLKFRNPNEESACGCGATFSLKS